MWVVGLLESMFIYCIFTQYLVGAPFALITASILRGMEVMPRLRTAPGVCALGWVKCREHISLLVILCIIVYVTNNYKKLVSRRKHEVLQNFLINGCSDVGFQKTQWTDTSRWHCTPNHHRLWKLNTGLQVTCALSFSTLPPDSRTLVYKWNTKLALIWKEDFGPLGNSPVLLLSPGKTPLMTTVSKLLDTSVCGALDALTPASVHSLWSSPKFLNRCCLTILIRLRFSRLVVHLFLPLNFLLTSLDTALCEQLLGNEYLCLTLLVKGVNDCLLDNCQISSLPHDCVA